jgi:two-component system cell cycle sensor histidine kinase/response regulator CckA
MTDIDLKSRGDGAGVVAPVTVVAALPALVVSRLAAALSGTSFVVAPAATAPEARNVCASACCAVLVTAFPVDPPIALWLESHRPSKLPTLLLASRSALEAAYASALADLTLADDAAQAELTQAVTLLARLALASRQPVSSPAPPDAAALLETLPFGLVVADSASRIVYANPTALRILSTTPDKLPGALLTSLLGDCGIETALDKSSAGQPWINGDFVRSGAQSLREIEYTASSVVVPGAQVVLLEDVTRRNYDRAQQQRAGRMESLGRLVGGMAHEFNNLLTVILGYSDLSVRFTGGDPRLADAMTQIKNSAERGASLTQMLLAFGRKQIMAPVWLELNQLVDGLEAHIRLLVGEGIRVEIRAAQGLPLVFVDPMLIQRAIVQVVINARDALGNKGTVTLATSELQATENLLRDDPELRPGRYVCLTVHDNGPGIHSDVRPFVFEPFFTTKGVGQGTGMGLAYVDGVMHQSGGGVDVISEAGKGTTLRLYFPTVGILPGVPPAAQPRSLLSEVQTTIVWVDDDAGVRKFGSLVLRSQGYDVIEARDGAEALHLIEHSGKKIDLVVTDVIMPVMSGIELGARLQELYPDLPVLYESGRTEDIQKTAGDPAGNWNFLNKPFTREALLAKVSQLLHRPPA